MLLKAFEQLPLEMQTPEVRCYYDLLKKKQFQLFLKRMFDVLAALLLCLLLSPVILILSIWIKIDSPGPIFYRQERITQNGKVFRIFKFRTMVQNADKKGALVTSKNDSRITCVGKKIRKSRIDEIPQLFNVLKGEMTFVGTRPEVKKYVDCYTNEMKATLLLPAGITSLASIKYRDEDEMIQNASVQGTSLDQIYIKDILPEKMKYNLTYLRQFNLTKDVYVCIKTIV